MDEWFSCDGCAQDYLRVNLVEVEDKGLIGVWYWMFCGNCLNDWKKDRSELDA